MTIKRKIAVFSLLGFVFATTALAADFVVPGKGGDANVTVSAAETRKNLYTAGANVTVNGQIMGDLFAAGGMVSLIGSVEQDINIAGGSLSLSGSVGGDARIAGGNVSISSPIGGDLLLAGGNVSITEKSSVGGDLLIGGGNVILDAPVKGKLRLAGGNVTINSRVEGNVEVYISGNGRNQGNLVFGPKAEVSGKIKYKGPKEAVIKEGAKVSSIDYTLYTGKKAHRAVAGLLTLAFVVKLIAWFLAGLLLLKYRKNSLGKIAQSIKDKPWESLGIGFAGLVVIPIAVILLLVVLVGYYIAAILALWYLLLLMFTGLVGALVLGAWLLRLISKTESFVFNWKALLLGVVVLSALKFIPFVGWLICLAVFLLALGALLRVAKEKWTQDS